MKRNNFKIFFYVPADLWPKDITNESGFFWSSSRAGKWNWTFQTYEYLKEAGLDCKLVKEIPKAGIIIAHTRLLNHSFKPNSRQLLVCIEADRGRQPYAQIHVQQNPVGTKFLNNTLAGRVDNWLFGLPTNIFIHYWPQPELIPRNPSRGDKFENIYFMGRSTHLAPKLKDQSFQNAVKELGLNFVIQDDLAKWNNYSEVDAILAVRDLTGKTFDNKPASKLINSWHAGVPCLLNPESAYLAERKSEYDFITITDLEGVINGLRKLKTNLSFRRKMVSNAKKRSKELGLEMVIEEWILSTQNTFYPAFERWQEMSIFQQYLFFSLRKLDCYLFWLRKKFFLALRYKLNHELEYYNKYNK